MINSEYLSAFITLKTGRVVIDIKGDEHSFSISENREARLLLDKFGRTFALTLLFSSSVYHPTEEGFHENFEFDDWLYGYTSK